jgi:hypothetical protein
MPDEIKSFDPDKADGHEEIDPRDRDQLHYWAARLKATPDELIEAVRTVGPNSTAVAIWLGSAGAV